MKILRGSYRWKQEDVRECMIMFCRRREVKARKIKGFKDEWFQCFRVSQTKNFKKSHVIQAIL